jgi:hypothetical protein
VIELGRKIVVNDEHCEKHLFPREMIELGMQICVNNEQP